MRRTFVDSIMRVLGISVKMEMATVTTSRSGWFRFSLDQMQYASRVLSRALIQDPRGHGIASPFFFTDSVTDSDLKSQCVFCDVHPRRCIDVFTCLWTG